MADIRGIPRVKSPGRDTSDNDATKLIRVSRTGKLITDLIEDLLYQGRVFAGSDADENDRVTGQTSYAATTPTFLLSVPAGTTAIPLLVSLGQAGTAAGGDISVMLSFDSVNRFSTGGTTETKVRSLRTDQPVNPQCTLYSGATATAATNAVVLCSVGEVPAVAGANTATRSDSFLTFRALDHFMPPLLVGPAAFLVFSYAASTAPTWEWSIQWGELPTSDIS